MRNMPLFLVLLTLAACTKTGQPLEPKEFFASLQGPTVPTMQDTMLDSAKNAEKKGDYKGAIQTYQQILEKHPDNKEVVLSLAEAYRRSGESDRAITLYDGLLQSDPNLVAAKEGKGLALISKGDFDTPVPLFESIMKTEPTRWKTLNALGILFTTRSMHKEAQQYFQEALKYSPFNPSIMNNLGLSQALDHSYEPAATTLMQASALTTADSNERKRIDLNLALVYAVSGRLDLANQIAERYFAGPVLSNNLGLYAHLAKDDQLAKDYLNMALTESKFFYEKAWNNLQAIDRTSDKKPDDKTVTLTKPEALPPFSSSMVEEKPSAGKATKSKKTVAAKPKKNVNPPSVEDAISSIVGTPEDDTSASDNTLMGVVDDVEDSPIK
jgi:Flp pilus assembly protein TadD